MTDGYNPNFDLDRLYGAQAEACVAGLRAELFAGRIEVKRKRRRDLYFYVETEQDPGRRGQYKPSGLQVTTADYWAYVIDDTGLVLLLPVAFLWIAISHPSTRSRTETTGDNPTRGRLINLGHILSDLQARKAAHA